MQIYLLGEHLAHSYSPEIHAHLADYRYDLKELRPEEVLSFLHEAPFDGLNVTIPYKQVVMEGCDALTEVAQRLGSVNTIVRREDGTLLGHNTDYEGFIAMLRAGGLEVRGKKVLVLGDGGASKTVRVALADLGAAEVVIISRRGENNYTNLERHADAQIIINTTPVGMYPNNGQSPLSLAGFPQCEGVGDLIYNPSKTALLLEAERLGIRAVNGLTMLVAQAKAAAERFLGQAIDDARVSEVTHILQRNSRNVMLIGMPGCGKSTIGRALAEAMGRAFIDVDHAIEAKIGGSIPAFFAQHGEAAFRAVEHEVLAEVSKGSGKVIATGGGVVTMPENMDLLRENSCVVFLTRPLEQLPVDGRPVSQSQSLEALYARRWPLYCQAADMEIANTGSVADVVAAIRKEWMQ